MMINEKQRTNYDNRWTNYYKAVELLGELDRVMRELSFSAAEPAQAKVFEASMWLDRFRDDYLVETDERR